MMRALNLGRTPEDTIQESDKIHTLFARNSEFTGRLAGLWEAMREQLKMGALLGDMAIATPQQRAELQVADWGAFELAQHADKRMSRPDLPIRWPIRQMRTKDTKFKLHKHARLLQGFADAQEDV